MTTTKIETDGTVDIGRLERGLALAAYLVVRDGPVVLPIFERLERELAAMRATAHAIERARRYVDASGGIELTTARTSLGNKHPPAVGIINLGEPARGSARGPARRYAEAATATQPMISAEIAGDHSPAPGAALAGAPV
jgi:hypothetical protein